MDAYKRAWFATCDRCSNPASYQVFDHQNRHIGVYCEEHADERVAELDACAEAALKRMATP